MALGHNHLSCNDRPVVMATGYGRDDNWRATINPLVVRMPEPRDRIGSLDPVACFEPVRGVTLELFAEISAAARDDQEFGCDLAALRGFNEDEWRHASKVWDTRISLYPAVAEQVVESPRSPEAALWLAGATTR